MTKSTGQSWEELFEEKFVKPSPKPVIKAKNKAEEFEASILQKIADQNIIVNKDDLKAFIKAEREEAVREFAYGLKMKFHPMRDDTPMSRMLDGTNKLVRGAIDEHIDQLVKEERGKP